MLDTGLKFYAVPSLPMSDLDTDLFMLKFLVKVFKRLFKVWVEVFKRLYLPKLWMDLFVCLIWA